MNFSLAARIRSFGHALRGLRFLLRSQQNAWIHMLVTVCVILAGALVRLSRTEWCLIVLAIAVVWAAEAFNTAIEFLVDLASPEIQPLAGKAKDIAAGGVLLSAVGAAIVGALVLGPHIVSMLSNTA